MAPLFDENFWKKLGRPCVKVRKNSFKTNAAFESFLHFLYKKRFEKRFKNEKVIVF